MSFLKPQFLFKSLHHRPPHLSFSNIGTSHARLLQASKPITKVYTRDYLREYTRDPNFEANKIKQQEEALQKKNEEKLLLNVSNDRNPTNFIRVKLKPVVLTSEGRYKPKKLPTKIPYHAIVQPRKPKITIQGVRRNVPSKIKKLLLPMRSIIGLHVYDALTLMYSKNRKSWSYVARTLEQVRKHAVHRGFNETRLYVSEALTGKHRRNAGIRYHGKGRGGRMKHDTSQLRIKLEEKSVEDLYKEMYKGKTPPMLAYFFKKRLFEQNAGYEQILNFQWILTGKGRQQQKLMLKRRVLLTYLKNMVRWLIKVIFVYEF